jgi:hypothetical protein
MSMKNIPVLLSFVLTMALAANPPLAVAQHATPKQAEGLVKEAIIFYKKNGKDAAIATFSKSPGPFVRGDLYVTVLSLNGDALAHINPRMVGKNLIDLRDVDGQYFVRERLATASRATSGWQDYKFYNPLSRMVEPKRVYWEKFDNLVFTAGAYKPE